MRIQFIVLFASSVTAHQVACSGPEGTTPEDVGEVAAIGEPSEAATPTRAVTRAHDPNIPVGFDIERQVYAYDADGDTFPDITEQLAGSDELDSKSHPGADQNMAGFPNPSCRIGFRQAGPRLCINDLTQNAATYIDASTLCRDQLAHVCTHEDLMYLYLRSSLDATYNPDGKWIGTMIADDTVLYGNATITFDNDPDIYNFEGNASKTASRAYWCCHDDDG